MWIKICGLTSAAAVARALELQVDAVGFVFAPSVRRVSAQAALELAAPARGRVRCVAVMRHPQPEELAEVLEVFAPDVLQSDAADFATLKLPAQLERLPVLRDGEEVPPELPGRLLYESAVSGSGRTSDWRAARQLARRTQLVLAGGLRAANVAQAIARVRPCGVDVSSGVEERPGLKSPAAMERFVHAVRAAAQNHSEVVP